MITALVESFILLACVALTGCDVFARGDVPLPRASVRPTPLHFGLYVTPEPENNPIDPPERFVGFHVGEDFEILAGEEESVIPVSAICDGKIVTSGWAEGYGGLVRQQCTIDGEEVTVIYGHLLVASLVPDGEMVSVGQQIGELGAGDSHDTDGNRMHLHLGVAKGWNEEMRGYVQTEAEIDEFIDPATVLP